MMRNYKIIDVFGNFKTVRRPQEMMQYYVDIGLAMEELSDRHGWRACYKGSRNLYGKIDIEPHKWDIDGLMEVYAPLVLAYKKIKLGQVMPPGYRNVA